MKPAFVALGIVVIIAALTMAILVKNEPSPETAFLTEREAKTILYAQYPALAAYETTSLPPSTVISKQDSQGWYFGFIREGSGLPGILDAGCYYVEHDKEIKVVGTYAREENIVAEELELSTCEPRNKKETNIETPVISIPAPTPSDPRAGPGCKRMGCSGTICVDSTHEDLATTCEYRPEYGCYQRAVCERQTNGQCGFTDTPELRACLLNPPQE